MNMQRFVDSARRQGDQRESERGAVIAEFVLVLPLLVILLFAIIEFGIVFNRVQGLHNAAREGARVASLNQTTQAEIQARVTSALTGVTYTVAPVAIVTPTINQPCNGREGQTVEVVVNATYATNIPFVPLPALNLTGNGTFRCEGG